MSSPAPTIVAIAYNRPQSLSRLLRSLSVAVYDTDRPTLVISIDAGDNQAVFDVADQFDWAHGKKEIIRHSTNLGLKRHVISCGDLSKRYERVVVLEDDIVVSPAYYQFAKASLERYAEDPNVSQISLYGYRRNTLINLPFCPISYGDSVYFMQSGSSWGQAWTRGQWERFRTWLQNNENDGLLAAARIPDAVKNWPTTSWKKWFNAFLAETDTYAVVPYVSYTTNTGDEGTNHAGVGRRYQVPLSLGCHVERLPDLSESTCVYDAYCELETTRFTNLVCSYVADMVHGREIVSDFYGLKQIETFAADVTICTAQQLEDPYHTYGDLLQPPIHNIWCQIPGHQYSLGPVESVRPAKMADVVRRQQTEEVLSRSDRVVLRAFATKLRGRMKRLFS